MRMLTNKDERKNFPVDTYQKSTENEKRYK